MGIKEIRKQTGMTQKEFSESYGIPLDTIKNWESGKREPADYVVRMLEYYVRMHNVHPDE